jgi:ATP synthase protein I
VRAVSRLVPTGENSIITGDSPMPPGDAQDPLRDLERRLASVARDGARNAPPPGADGATGSLLALAWRVGLELVVAVVVATGIGWAFDRWLGTRPWGMIVMFFLGVAAGMVNVWRTVTGMGMAVGYRQNGTKERRDGED